MNMTSLITLYRNTGFGSAAICLGLLVSIAQIGATSPALKISVLCASFALPLWVFFGLIFGKYLLMGSDSYGHIRTSFATAIIQLTATFATIGLTGAVEGVIYSLSESGAILFLTTLFGGLVVYLYFGRNLRQWFSSASADTSK